MDLLNTAMLCGVSEKVFWQMTPAQVDRAVTVHYDNLKEEYHRNEYVAWLYGLYNRVAYHSKHYPAAPVSGQQPKEMSEEQMKAVMRGLSKRRVRE